VLDKKLEKKKLWKQSTNSPYYVSLRVPQASLRKTLSIHGRLSTKAATTESTDILWQKFNPWNFKLVHGELSHDWIAQSRK
jgi:hypothetical protein